MYFDSHAHYNDEVFDQDLDELIGQMPSHKVDLIMNVGADMKSSEDSVELAKRYKMIYASVGVHPHDVKHMTEKNIDILKELAKYEKVLAIGEIGLDFYYNHSEEEEQIYWFKKQLELAKEVDLPVIIHSRDASKMTYDIIEESGIKEGVIHCYSGSKELAEQYVKKGFYLGIGGALTFKNAKKTVEVVESVPLSHIVIETDCPYLTPVPHRGKRNDSSYLVHIVDKIAEIKGITSEEVAKITLENAKKLFRMK
ncbi:MAG: TatD family hydrolase [Cellulosilyticaceae bacterium]